MAQKINPLSFRAKNKMYFNDTKWFLEINHFNYPHLMHQDFEIEEMIKDFCSLKQVYVHKIKIHRYETFNFIEAQIYNGFDNIQKEKNLLKKKLNRVHYRYKKMPTRKNINYCKKLSLKTSKKRYKSLDVFKTYKKYLLFLLRKNLKLEKSIKLYFNFKFLAYKLNKPMNKKNVTAKINNFYNLRSKSLKKIINKKSIKVNKLGNINFKPKKKKIITLKNKVILNNIILNKVIKKNKNIKKVSVHWSYKQNSKKYNKK